MADEALERLRALIEGSPALRQLIVKIERETAEAIKATARIQQLEDALRAPIPAARDCCPCPTYPPCTCGCHRWHSLTECATCDDPQGEIRPLCECCW